MNEPIDVATAETVAFLTIPPRLALVIEFISSEWHVAQTLSNRGYRVIGLDAADQNVAARTARSARRSGDLARIP